MYAFLKRLYLTGILAFAFCCFSVAGNTVLTGDDQKVSKSLRISDLEIDTLGKIHWTAFNQSGVVSFSVEQFMNEHWVMIGEIVGDASSEENPYTYSPHLHSGENRYRIGWETASKDKKYSNVVVTVSRRGDVYFQLSTDNQKITFTENTYYMVYNPYGFITNRGFGNSLDVSDFKPGMYCITYDNKVATFEKKPVWFSHSKHPIVRENKPEHFKKVKKPFEMTPP
jgi:hypothetical protein